MLTSRIVGVIQVQWQHQKQKNRSKQTFAAATKGVQRSHFSGGCLPRTCCDYVWDFRENFFCFFFFEPKSWGTKIAFPSSPVLVPHPKMETRECHIHLEGALKIP